MKKKDFTRFTKRNTHKRRDKDAVRRELLRAVRETEVGYSGVVIRDSVDTGRRGRTSVKRHRDEVITEGIFSGSSSGYGFVSLEGVERDIFIPSDKTSGAIDGDYVEIIYHAYRNYSGEEKTEGRVTKIIKYGRETLIGTLVREDSYRYRSHRCAILLPDDARIPMRPRITDLMGARIGDKVEVRIKRGTGGYSPEADIIAIYGDTLSMDANYRAILSECEIPDEFTAEELEEAGRVAKKPLSDEGRERFAGKVILTIDGEGAKDLDDAVSLSKTRTGWQLGVHIADVSAYVSEKTVLDRLVMNRGTSVYFTDKVVPMLPKSLSNGACSLNAGEEKYTLSAIIDLDKDGAIKSARVTPSVIVSRVRGVYSEVNRIFDGDESPELMKKYKPALPTLMRMRELYLLLAKRSKERGYIDMSIDEAAILLDSEGNPTDVVRIERGDAERMIEQFMLTANEAVATLLYEKGIPCVYRVHERPSPDKLDSLKEYLRHVGIKTSVGDFETVTSKDFSAVLDEAEESGKRAAVSRTMLRSMMKAKYSEVKEGHFGLGIENYCHFTSPIRRLSDLATHRIIHRVLIEDKRPEAYRSYAKRAARAATDTELRALAAERRIENLYKTVYMSKRVGETFDAEISSVTQFGIFAELDNTCEGLIPISELPGLFTFYEQDLTIRQGEMIFRIGDRIKVRVEEADVIRGKLRFSLIF